MNASQILQRDEIAAILAHLAGHCKQGKRASPSWWQTRIVFRLSCCCGLRRKEIGGLNLGDLITTGPRPCIHVRKAITKGRTGKRKARTVPLWIDAGTLGDLQEWVAMRRGQGAGPGEPLLCPQHPLRSLARLHLGALQHRWQTAVAVLGAERAWQVGGIHCGRHSFASHCLDAGHSLVAVRDWLGHSSINMTSRYAHILPREHVPDVFGNLQAAAPAVPARRRQGHPSLRAQPPAAAEADTSETRLAA
jgi:integrase